MASKELQSPQGTQKPHLTPWTQRLHASELVRGQLVRHLPLAGIGEGIDTHLKQSWSVPPGTTLSPTPMQPRSEGNRGLENGCVAHNFHPKGLTSSSNALQSCTSCQCGFQKLLPPTQGGQFPTRTSVLRAVLTPHSCPLVLTLPSIPKCI